MKVRRITLCYYIMSNIDFWRSCCVTVANLKVLSELSLTNNLTVGESKCI